MSRLVNCEIRYIKIKYLSVVWVQAQRPYNEKKSKHICDNLDPEKFEPITVTLANGVGIYHVVEGQHRVHALEMYAAKVNKTGYGGDEEICCRVLPSADPARAAEIWLGINGGRNAPRPVSGFRVAVTAKRPLEVAIDKIVERCGYYVREDGGTDNVITAVNSLRRVYTMHGELVLTQTLNVVRSIWGGDPQGVHGILLRGFGLFLNEFGRYYDKSRLPKLVLGKYRTPYRLLEAAKARKERTLDPLDETLSDLLLRDYNKGLPDDKRLARKS
jgi:hypothetical protein